MLLACIAVCMSNMSFSLHGFSVHVPCQTLSFSQPSLILSPQNYLFKSPLCPLLFTLFDCLAFFLYCFNSSLAPTILSLLPPLILCTKYLSDASLTLYLWLKARRSALSVAVSSRGAVRGCQDTNTKQYPIVHPPFCFLQWEASSTKDIWWFWGPERALDRAGTKL